MTERWLLGVALFNLFVLAWESGSSGECAAGGPGSSSRGSPVRRRRPGVAALGISFSLELIVGVPFSLRRSWVPGWRSRSAAWQPESRSGDLVPPGGPRRPMGSGRRCSLVALVVVYMEALFRAARLQGLSAWDAWAFWVPKAKAIYFFGGLDAQFFSELPTVVSPALACARSLDVSLHGLAGCRQPAPAVLPSSAGS